ncbi:GTP-binding protein Di-Ras1 [Anopheles stephensi]|uniref:GTP-binding protein Di-Ras1 n=1 Tax=Anopheles stephensi TaxID=30069 RepID=UPI001658AFEB|nr:GTP-binding protein Di-Ras1 [Anopheles stephensi]XP_035911650.1 GTP-binding protein Di-Ras1 [Anopheles stephensi]XP_035911651.1 GTP-binding protein Di-Ras1 [Anopheles stephensi]XP_035911652.1 GTP-binding protein Di-Ras1 [Anopheles stephensi]XP_035911653.1 GTP-binding protein Di-Ras1 [Anopheles stephensi]XP_035911654.1 GTP-binding protein Di-Ras1 [Anopheles stephensi]XP_035911655.1 GTP-binding protein Di-Ras1 [Anopheles stephensi]
MKMSDFERIRLVILGGAGVGKSCIIKRFLFKTYSDKYRPTVEDLYNREYDLGSVTLKVDILDTSGEMQFPAMRRLSIATAHAFLLVYATTSEGSLGCIKQCFEEIREQRADFQDIPMVIVGNKYDLTSSHREVRIEDVSEWVFCELPKLKVKVLECSAKDDYNIMEIFRTFVTLSRILPVNGSAESGSGLKRRSSAYVSASSKAKSRIGSPSIGGCEKPKDSSFLAASTSEGTSSGSGVLAGVSGSDVKAKPRSRSLIRRSSRKTKQQIQNASGAEDCNIQ